MTQDHDQENAETWLDRFRADAGSRTKLALTWAGIAALAFAWTWATHSRYHALIEHPLAYEVVTGAAVAVAVAMFGLRGVADGLDRWLRRQLGRVGRALAERVERPDVRREHVAATAFALLVVVSAVAVPLATVGVERSQAAKAEVVVEDWEGDISDWSGASRTTADPYEGTYSGLLPDSSNGNLDGISTISQPDSFTVPVRYNGSSYEANIDIRRGSSVIMRMVFQTDRTMRLDNVTHTVDTDLQLETGTWYILRLEFNYEEDTAILKQYSRDGTLLDESEPLGLADSNEISKVRLSGTGGGDASFGKITANSPDPADPAYTINGTVTDANGTALENAEVTVTNSTGGTVNTTTTNSSGFYSVPVDSGDFRVEASKPGFTTEATSVSISDASKSGIDLQLELDDEFDYTLNVCYSGEAEFDTGTAEAYWYNTIGGGASPYVDERSDLPPDGSGIGPRGDEANAYTEIYEANSIVALYDPVGGVFGAYPGLTRFQPNGNTTTTLQPYNYTGLRYSVEVSTDRSYFMLRGLDPSTEFNQVMFPGPPAADGTNETTATPTQACQAQAGVGDTADSDGPAVLGTCTIPTEEGTETGIMIEYFDEEYETDSLEYSLEYEDTWYNGTKQFDEPKGYFVGCVGAGSVPPGGPTEDPGGSIKPCYQNGTCENITELPFQESDPFAGISGGGPIGGGGSGGSPIVGGALTIGAALIAYQRLGPGDLPERARQFGEQVSNAAGRLRP